VAKANIIFSVLHELKLVAIKNINFHTTSLKEKERKQLIFKVSLREGLG